ncbi:variant erythrocyte surface antigen-1 family protein [Babesia caballi]|uniref:Variant erythrocyte surface antigen-1 family protein n=1 Tax=Babesia caballi TaxID=5871 RepID=A0AAV4LVL6_BABCB|nr:variant erythrocyte surface antigen-1 family protein [Babesia caballi]
MTDGKKSLTDAPENLKEAIDWVLRVSGKENGQNDNGAIKGLAGELVKLLGNDASEVARGVLRVMGENLKRVVEGLESFQNKNTIGTTALRGLMKKVSKSLQKVTDYGSAADRAYLEKLREMLQQDVTNPGEGPIGKLAQGLANFIGWNGNAVAQGGIGKQGSYASSYKNEATWPTQSGEKETCAYVFLGLLPLVFYFLSYIYYWCKSRDGWSGQKFNSQSELKTFMESDAVGFRDHLKDSKQGSDVATRIGEKCFQEIKNAYESAKKNPPTNPPQDPPYGSFIKHYERLARELSPSHSEYSLIKCFAIATPYFTPNVTYTAQSTSPATPSFLGYSGPAALAGGAYGFNLGGLNTFLNAFLA